MDHLLPRYILLPDLDRSRAVLVGLGDGGRGSPGELASCLADALTSPDIGRPFYPWHIQVLIDPAELSDVCDTVERVAGEASDVLLFYYGGRGVRHDQFFAGSAGLATVAGLMSRSPAVRPIVILDSDNSSTGWSCFTSKALPWNNITHPVSLTLLAPTADSHSAPSFTGTLVRALTAGIEDGPDVPELADLLQAIRVEYVDHALGAATESYAPPIGDVVATERRSWR